MHDALRRERCTLRQSEAQGHTAGKCPGEVCQAARGEALDPGQRHKGCRVHRRDVDAACVAEGSATVGQVLWRRLGQALWACLHCFGGGPEEDGVKGVNRAKRLHQVGRALRLHVRKLRQSMLRNCPQHGVALSSEGSPGSSQVGEALRRLLMQFCKCFSCSALHEWPILGSQLAQGSRKAGKALGVRSAEFFLALRGSGPQEPSICLRAGGNCLFRVRGSLRPIQDVLQSFGQSPQTAWSMGRGNFRSAAPHRLLPVCCGAGASRCLISCKQGVERDVQAFLATLLLPFHVTKPRAHATMATFRQCLQTEGVATKAASYFREENKTKEPWQQHGEGIIAQASVPESPVQS